LVEVSMSATKEKIIVLAGTIGSAITGYLAAIGRPAEAALVGTVSAAVITFWSEAINTNPQ